MFVLLFLIYVCLIAVVARAVCVGLLGCAEGEFAIVLVGSVLIAAIATIIKFIVFGR